MYRDVCTKSRLKFHSPSKVRQGQVKGRIHNTVQAEAKCVRSEVFPIVWFFVSHGRLSRWDFAGSKGPTEHPPEGATIISCADYHGVWTNWRTFVGRMPGAFKCESTQGNRTFIPCNLTSEIRDATETSNSVIWICIRQELARRKFEYWWHRWVDG